MFTVKTSNMGDYEFNAYSPEVALKWKGAIEQHSEQAKLTKAAVQQREEYKASLATYETTPVKGTVNSAFI